LAPASTAASITGPTLAMLRTITETVFVAV
jgi:hypothetical protein